MFKSNKLSGVWVQFPFFFSLEYNSVRNANVPNVAKSQTLGNFHTSNFLFDDL